MKLEVVNMGLLGIGVWDWENVRKHWLPDDPFQPEFRTPSYYKGKAWAAQWTGAKSICEIGVRAGYSAAAFFQSPVLERYVGIDLNGNDEGGFAGSLEYAKKVMEANPQIDSVLAIGDSQKMSWLPYEGTFDLVHIDGDHSYAGATHDLELAIRTRSRWVLIDDFDFISEVRIATMDLMDKYNVNGWYIYDRNYRGSILFETPEEK